MMAWIFSPRGLGAVAGVLSILCLATAIVGLPLASHLIWDRSTLGEFGTAVYYGAIGVLVLEAVYLGGVATLLRDLGGVASRLDRRFVAWRRLGATAGVVLGVCVTSAVFAFVSQFVVILGPGPEYYDQAEWLGFALYIPNERFSRWDFFTALIFMFSAASAGGTYLRISLGESVARLPREFFGLLAAGFSYLAIDEYFTIHEFIGGNLPVLRDVTFVKHPDDLIMLIYFGLAGLVLLRFLPALLSDRVGAGIMGFAVVVHGMAAMSDGWLPHRFWQFEELCEVLAASSYFLFTVRYGEAVRVFPWADGSTVPLVHSELGSHAP